MKRFLSIAAFMLLCLIVCAEGSRPIAKVDNYSGIRVFSYCEPVAEYNVLGDVSFDCGSGGSTYTIGGMTFADGGGDKQYNEIRNSLIIAAVMANRTIDGVIIHPTKAHSGRATMIKFKDGVKDKDLAYVSKMKGYYIFVDCKPIGDYEYQGKRRCSALVDNSSDAVIGNILTNTKNLSRQANAVIVTFKTGGYDYSEAIILK